MNINKRPSIVPAFITVMFVGLAVLVSITFIITYLITALWNYVALDLNIPSIKQLHALAILMLLRLFRFEYKWSTNAALNTMVNHVKNKQSSTRPNIKNRFSV